MSASDFGGKALPAAPYELTERTGQEAGRHPRRLRGDVGALVLLAAAALACARGSGPLTAVEQVRRLGPDEARRDRAVRLRGVVTLHDPESRVLFLQDRTGGIAVDVSNLAIPTSLGQEVEVEGVAGPGDVFPVVLRPSIETVGAGPAPPPRALTIGELASGREDGQWVEVEGIVRSGHVRRDGTMRLEVGGEGGSFDAHVYDHSAIVLSSWLDAAVRVRGVAASDLDAKGEVVRSRLLVASPEQVTVVEAPPDSFSRAASPIRELVGRAGTAGTGHRVRVRGELVAQDPGGDLVVRDGTGELRARLAHPAVVEGGDLVDVVGFLAIGPSGGARLEEAVVRPAAPPGAEAPAAAAGPRSRPGPVGLVTTAAELRALTAHEARQGRRVRLRAVVTYYDPGWSMLFVQDPTGGVYVDVNGQPAFGLEAGHLVEVEGLSDPGDFAPQVVEPRIRVLGRGPLPPARPSSGDRLFTGRLDSQWVEVEGVVRAVRQEEDRLWLELAAGLYRFSVHAPGLWDPVMLAALVDARVAVRGASGTLFNDRRQLVGVQVYVPGPAFVEVRRPGTADPFSIPLRSIATLLQFRSYEEAGHRVRVQGVVTLVNRQGFFLADDTGGLPVRTRQAIPLQVGDRVEAVGFPVAGGQAPVLRDAILRRGGGGDVPDPTPVTAGDVAGGDHDGSLVRIDAYLVDRLGNSREQVLALRAGRTLFNAHLEQAVEDAGLASLRPGSLLRLTGICSVESEAAEGSSLPRSFRLLLRSPRDVGVLESAPWWTPRRVLGAGSVLLGLVVAAAAWVVVLKRQVRAQTDLIRRGQRELLVSEKMASLGRLTAGIAHEMSTPLATVRAVLFEVSKLTAEYQASLGDESVTPDDHREIAEEMRRAIGLADKAAERATGFVRGIKSQTREMAAQDGVEFEAAPVVEEALLLLGHAARKAKCTLEFHRSAGPVSLQGVPGRLAQVVTNLITNAIDASAGRGGAVRLELAPNGTTVNLRVSDQGCGIPPESLSRVFDPLFTSKRFGEGTGLGLSIVHDIVTDHFGGEVRVESELNKGTTFEVSLPRAGAPRPEAGGRRS